MTLRRNSLSGFLRYYLLDIWVGGMTKLSFKEWMAAAFRDSDQLDDLTLDIVAEFTLYWGVFEGVECKGRGGHSQFEIFATQVASKISDGDLDGLLAYWVNRYTDGGSTNTLFERLNFRHADKKDLVQQVLLGEGRSTDQKILALLIIVYRLRNNLFHSLKTINRLNEQQQNLNHACLVLQELMPLSRQYLYLDAA